MSVRSSRRLKKKLDDVNLDLASPMFFDGVESANTNSEKKRRKVRKTHELLFLSFNAPEDPPKAKKLATKVVDQPAEDVKKNGRKIIKAKRILHKQSTNLENVTDQSVISDCQLKVKEELNGRNTSTVINGGEEYNEENIDCVIIAEKVQENSKKSSTFKGEHKTLRQDNNSIIKGEKDDEENVSYVNANKTLQKSINLKKTSKINQNSTLEIRDAEDVKENFSYISVEETTQNSIKGSTTLNKKHKTSQKYNMWSDSVVTIENNCDNQVTIQKSSKKSVDLDQKQNSVTEIRGDEDGKGNISYINEEKWNSSKKKRKTLQKNNDTLPSLVSKIGDDQNDEENVCYSKKSIGLKEVKQNLALKIKIEDNEKNVNDIEEITQDSSTGSTNLKQKRKTLEKFNKMPSDSVTGIADEGDNGEYIDCVKSLTNSFDLEEKHNSLIKDGVNEDNTENISYINEEETLKSSKKKRKTWQKNNSYLNSVSIIGGEEDNEDTNCVNTNKTPKKSFGLKKSRVNQNSDLKIKVKEGNKENVSYINIEERTQNSPTRLIDLKKKRRTLQKHNNVQSDSPLTEIKAEDTGEHIDCSNVEETIQNNFKKTIDLKEQQNSVTEIRVEGDYKENINEETRRSPKKSTDLKQHNFHSNSNTMIEGVEDEENICLNTEKTKKKDPKKSIDPVVMLEKRKTLEQKSIIEIEDEEDIITDRIVQNGPEEVIINLQKQNTTHHDFSSEFKIEEDNGDGTSNIAMDVTGQENSKGATVLTSKRKNLKKQSHVHNESLTETEYGGNTIYLIEDKTIQQNPKKPVDAKPQLDDSDIVVITLEKSISPSTTNDSTLPSMINNSSDRIFHFNCSEEDVRPSTSGLMNFTTTTTTTKRRTYELENSVNDISLLKTVSQKDSFRMNSDPSPENHEGLSVHVNNYSKVTLRRKFNEDSRLSDVSPPWMEELTVAKTPEKTSTPVIVTKSRSLLKNVLTRNKNEEAKPSTTKKFSAIKVPNFAAIHQKALDKMESIDDYKLRKEERARHLLSGRKPTSNKTPKKQIKKQLKFAPDIHNREKSIGFIPLPNTPMPKRRINDSIDSPKTPINKENKIMTPRPKEVVAKINLPQAKVLTPKNFNDLKRDGFNRFGFHIGNNNNKLPNFGNNVKPAVLKEVMKASIATKSKPAKNMIETRRTAIKGVRSNRRFELLMNMRKGK